MFSIFLGLIAILLINSVIPRWGKIYFPSSPNEVSNPIIPYFAWMKSIFLSSFSWGVWSVVITSIIFSFSAFISALLSFKERNGGKTLYLVSKLFTQLSVRNKL